MLLHHCLRHQRHRARARGGAGAGAGLGRMRGGVRQLRRRPRIRERAGAARPASSRRKCASWRRPCSSSSPQLGDLVSQGQCAVLLLVAPASEPGLREFVAPLRRQRRAAQERRRGGGAATARCSSTPGTTPRCCALKLDKSLTYIQSRFEPARHVAQAKALERALGGEVLMHLEFLRGMDGACNCSGAAAHPLHAATSGSRRSCRSTATTASASTIRMSSSSRTASRPGSTPAVLAMKERFDPAGLLNPGKLRGSSPR